MDWVLAALAAVVVLGAGALIWFGLPAFLRLRGKQVVTCPETGRKVSVEVDLSEAVKSAVNPSQHHLKLKDCTLWPERAGCHQLCVGQIERNPEGCYYQRLLGQWYRGKNCTLCQQPFGEIHWHDHKPGLMDSNDEVFGWDDRSPEQLIENLEQYRPICWNCLVAEDFRHRYPDLVTDRDFRTGS